MTLEERTIRRHTQTWRRVRIFFPWVCSLVFLLEALALLPYPGLQNDEVYFANPVFAPDTAFYHWRFGATKIPVMVMSYSGALKTWLYEAIFRIAAPSIWSVRLPVVLAGCGTILLTWMFVRRIAGVRAAAIATLLLATDTSFLLTDTFDWGPVALQHLLLMAGLAAMCAWVQQGSEKMLALGCFLWGLGLWDKALLIWPLLGLAAAVVVVYPRETLRRVRVRAVAIAIGAGLLGASPLVEYNINRHGETATENTKLSLERFGYKVAVLKQTLNASGLMGYMAHENGPGQRAPDSPLERASVWLAGVTGDHRKDWLIPAMCAAMVCGLAWGEAARRKLMIFTAVVLVVMWIQMALTRNAGGAAHHVVLLWPFPMVLVGLGLDAAAARIPRWGLPVAVGVTFVLIVQNLLTVNHYLATFAMNGSSTQWSDAVLELSDALNPESGKEIEVVDWGFANSLRVLHRGRLRLNTVGDWLVNPVMNSDETLKLKRMIASKNSVFVRHTEGNEILAGVNEHLRRIAMDSGFEEKIERVVRDSNGRPIFALVSFEPAPGAGETAPVLH